MVFRGDRRGKHARGANANQHGARDGGQTQHHQRPFDIDELSRQGHLIGASSGQTVRFSDVLNKFFTCRDGRLSPSRLEARNANPVGTATLPLISESAPHSSTANLS
jgi:hypothetical protein